MGTWQQQASNLNLNLLLASTTRLHCTSAAQTQTHKETAKKERVQIVRFIRTDWIATAPYCPHHRALSGDERLSRTSERSQVASAFKIFKWPAQLLHKREVPRFHDSVPPLLRTRACVLVPLPRIISSWRTSPFRRRSARTGSEQWRHRCGCGRKAKAQAALFWIYSSLDQNLMRTMRPVCLQVRWKWMQLLCILRWVLHITLAYCILN